VAETLSGVNGKIIQWAREYYNMSYEEAAQRIGVDVDKYKNWENGTDYPTYAKSVMPFISQVHCSSFRFHPKSNHQKAI